MTTFVPGDLVLRKISPGYTMISREFPDNFKYKYEWWDVFRSPHDNVMTVIASWPERWINSGGLCCVLVPTLGLFFIRGNDLKHCPSGVTQGL